MKKSYRCIILIFILQAEALWLQKINKLYEAHAFPVLTSQHFPSRVLAPHSLVPLLHVKVFPFIVCNKAKGNFLLSLKWVTKLFIF